MATKSIRLSDGTDTLLPENAVTGSNANGHYTKFAEGTMIQWNSVDVNLTLSQINTSGVYSATTTITFPIAFPNTRYFAYGSSRYGTGHIVPIGTIQAGAGYMTVGVYDFYPRSGSIIIHWCVVGRWK